MKRYLFTANALLALCCAGTLLSDDIVLKPHEEWWQKNWAGKDENWLGGTKMISRAMMRSHVRQKGYKTILDIPCGNCIDYKGIKEENVPVHYTGMDITPLIVERANKLGINVKHGSIEAIPMADSSVDITYSRHILEHLSYYEKALAELIRVAAKEVFVVFFIKPMNQKDDVKTLDLNGFPVYHNRYDKAKLEQYVLNFAKVDHIEWEDIDRVEAILHIYVKPLLNQSSPLTKSIDFDASLAALDPLMYYDPATGKTTPYYLAKDFLLEKPVFSGGWNAMMYPEPVNEFYNFLKDLYQRNDPSKIKPSATYKIPRIVHQIWIQGEMPQQFREWAKSWQNIPGWHYKFWTDKEIRALPLKARDAYDKADGYGVKADIARYEILRLFGGVCPDTDFKCLQPQAFDLLHRSYDFYTSVSTLDTAVFCLLCGLIGCAPHHPIMEGMCDFLAQHYDPTLPDFLRAGPVPFSKIFWHYADKPGYTDVAFPPSLLYPTGYYTPLEEYNWRIKPETWAVHYWARSWSTNPKF